MAKMKKTDNIKCSEDVEHPGLIYWWEHKMVQPLWEGPDGFV